MRKETNDEIIFERFKKEVNYTLHGATSARKEK